LQDTALNFCAVFWRILGQ